MKKMMVLILWLSLTQHLKAQDDVKSTVIKMNQCLSGFSVDQTQPLSFFAISGMLEQKQSNLIQRIAIASISKIQVEVSKLGYSVTLTCSGGESCINLVKTDMNTSTMGSTSFFFNNPGAANTFASQCQKLIAKTRKSDVAGELLLYKDANGQTSLLLDQQPNNATPPASLSAEPKAGGNLTQSTPKPKEKTIREIQEEDNDDTEETKQDKKNKPSKTKRTKEDKEGNEEKEMDEDDDNANTKSKRKNKQPQEPEINEDLTKKSSGTNKKKSNEESEFEQDLDDEQRNKKDLCDQLLNIVKSGKNTQFKDIEGKETNAEKKVNESKIKLRGARKSYLSWFNSKRSFIAELKLVDDNDYAIEEFQNLQNELDECLSGWEDDDHSTDAVYDNVNYEAKDVEYSNPNDPKSPTIRIAIVSEGKKFILFVRVQ